MNFGALFYVYWSKDESCFRLDTHMPECTISLEVIQHFREGTFHLLLEGKSWLATHGVGEKYVCIWDERKVHSFPVIPHSHPP
jgi:hypothetical protein